MWRRNGHTGRLLNILGSRIRIELRNGCGNIGNKVSLDYWISEDDGRIISIKTSIFFISNGRMTC